MKYFYAGIHEVAIDCPDCGRWMKVFDAAQEGNIDPDQIDERIRVIRQHWRVLRLCDCLPETDD